jgi:ABC-type phosphate transport system permease subunit
MPNTDYMKKVVGAIIGALIGIPSIGIGFYVTYQVVTALGN